MIAPLLKSLRTASVLLCALALAPAAAQPVRQTPQPKSDFLTEYAPLPFARGFHGTAVLRDYLYVFGGAGKSDKNEEGELSVQFAPISAEGRMGAWRETTPLPAPARFYIGNSTVVLNDFVYIMGGALKIEGGGARAETALYTTPGPDGNLLPWQQSQKFPEIGLSFVSAFATPGYLHMAGGVNSENTLSNRVWSVRVLPDGSLGAWEASAPLPIPLWYHQAAVAGGRVYLWGGLLDRSSQSPKPSRAVYSAPVLGSGKLGIWREEQPLQVPFYSAATTAVGSYLFCFCPRYGGAPYGTPSNDVWWTTVTPQGLQPWRRQQTSLMIRLYEAVAPDFRRGKIFFDGGKEGRDSDITAKCYSFNLSPAVRRQAEAGWGAGTGAAADAAENLTSATPAPGASKLPAGFVDYQRANEALAQGRRRLIVYFTRQQATPCQEQDKILASAPAIAALGKDITLAVVDVNAYPQTAQLYGVFKVPTWIYYNSAGAEVSRSVGVTKAEEIGLRAKGLN